LEESSSRNPPINQAKMMAKMMSFEEQVDETYKKIKPNDFYSICVYSIF
jgi:hypothetical protein